MKIPEVFYGKKNEVKKAIRPFIKRIKDGQKILEAFNGNMVDTNDHSCVVSITHILNINNEENCFYLYLLLEELFEGTFLINGEKISNPRKKITFYDDLYKVEWLSLLLLNQRCLLWHNLKGCNDKKYIKRILEIWHNIKIMKLGFGNYFQEPVCTSSRMLWAKLSYNGLPEENFEIVKNENDLPDIVAKYNICGLGNEIIK